MYIINPSDSDIKDVEYLRRGKNTVIYDQFRVGRED